MIARITDWAAISAFILGGCAFFTIVNPKSGTRYTFKVNKPRRNGAHSPWFISVLTGPSIYTYLGVIFPDNPSRYHHGRRSKISSEDPSAKCFLWLWHYRNSPEMLKRIEFWHEGRCCVCGRRLTVPESIASGIGPTCAKRKAA